MADPIEYVVALGRNSRLEKRARRLMGKARMLSKATGQTEHLFGETRYAARRWTRKRRVIIKAEVVRHPGRTPKNNPRFVVTNLPAQGFQEDEASDRFTPANLYEVVYCARGECENVLKQQVLDLHADRMSTHHMASNQLRLWQSRCYD